MKQRVAIFATTLIFALLMAFVFLCASFARQTMQADSLRELTTITRLAAAAGGDPFDREKALQALRQATPGPTPDSLVYAPDGTLAHSFRSTFSDALGNDARAAIAGGSLSSEVRAPAMTEGTWLFGYAALPDGGVFAVAQRAPSLMDMFAGKFLLLLLVAFSATGLCLMGLLIANQRTDQFVIAIQNVLENFSEGQFDSQIHCVGDSLEQTAHFNAVMGRIRDRVFKQKTRNQAFNAIIGHMQNGIIAVDEKLNLMLVNPAAKKLLNIAGSPEGQPINEISKDVNMSQVLKTGMEQNSVYTNEVRVRSASGRSPAPLRLYVSPMKDGEKVVGAVALIADITEIKNLEQVRTDFAANVSHELKTPLTSIMGFVETLQDGAINKPEMAKKFLRIIMTEAERLKRLINDILSITKLESGNNALPSKPVRLDQMVDDICDMLDFQASEKNVAIHRPSNPEHSYVMANPDSVEQMLINLIENAIKYNKDGGSVRVSLHHEADKINLTVADTGIGIAQEDIPKLSERFYRVDKGRSRQTGGTGLGLAIVKYLLRAMNGSFEVHSELGVGTEFLITLPRLMINEDEIME